MTGYARDPSAPLYSIWLLPEEASYAGLLGEIARLARLFHIPPFPPHATVQGDIAHPLEELRLGMSALLEGASPLELRVGAVEMSPEFFRSLYLRFAPSEGFDALRRKSGSALATAEGLSPFPHLSLSYGEYPGPAAKKAEAEGLSARYQGRSLAFTRLALALSSSALSIDRWEILEEHPL